MDHTPSSLHAGGRVARDHRTPCFHAASHDGAFDLPRFSAALVTLLVGVWKGNLLLAIAAGGVTLYSMLNFGF